MSMQFNISAEESSKAKIPHEIFLFNLIFNHILIFVALLTSREFAQYVFIVPINSAVIIFLILLGAQRAKSTASWYVNGHWQLCAKRNVYFLMIITFVIAIFIFIYIISGGDMKPHHWAFGGAVALPTMVTLLILIVMESEALHHASLGILPNWVREKYPLGSLEPIAEKKSPQGQE